MLSNVSDWQEHIEDYIRESNLIEGIDDAHENANSLEAWSWLLQVREITAEIVCELQGRIVKDNDWLPAMAKGTWRRCGVRVGAHIAPGWEKVTDLMDAWIAEFFDTGVIEAHVAFEMIHPFVDGNGRTGRMLYWWHCMMWGTAPILFTADARASYYQLFRAPMSLDEWVRFILPEDWE